MIFVTVGAQMPFDRLIVAIDEWAATRNRRDVFAQIGPTYLKPKMISVVPFLAPQEFRSRVSEADLVLAHAGMGSIITALELGKPIIVMPRRGDLLETRNDHQVATAESFRKSGRIMVASDAQELVLKLDEFSVPDRFERIESYASPRLLATLRVFLADKG